MKTYSETYREMSDADKAALKELKEQESKRLGVDVTLRDMLEAVTPGCVTPEKFGQTV